MKEYSCQVAIELCMKNGGRIQRKGFDTWYSKTAVDRRQFSADEICSRWIYDPPRTEFQKRLAEKSAINGKTPNDWRKEGWNEFSYAIEERFKNELNTIFVRKDLLKLCIEAVERLREP